MTRTAGAIVTTGEPARAVVGGKTEVYGVSGDLKIGVITER